MAVYLDDQGTTLSGRSLRDVLDAAHGQLQAAGRLVVEVQFNGQALVGEQLEEQADSPLPTDAEVRLYSADPFEVSLEALEQVRQQLLDQQTVLGEAADLLQQDQAADAFIKIGQVNEVWLSMVQTVLQTAQLMRINLASVTVNGKPFTGYTSDLFHGLQTLRQQVQDRDVAALADTLAHEWPEAIQQWDAVIGSLIEHPQA